jgi:hypothetical protein
MNDSGPVLIEDFRSALAECGKDYILISQSGSDTAHIRFLGTFAASPVIWDATVQTMKYRDASAQRQYIDIAPQGFPLRCITIGLNVPAVDPPVLLKTITMIRKYKRLHAGRHEFGTATLNE